MWAYSPELKTFCDGLIGRERAMIIPWPYDLAATQKLGRDSVRDSGQHRILVQVPMSFHDIVQNHPFVLKGVLLDVWQELPGALREKLTFHTFIYNSTDLERYKSSEFGKGLPFVLEGKRGYRSFVRFLGECDGVINLTAGSILGRITFLAAALGRPGIFSDNSQLNARLYPGSRVAMFDTVRLRELVGGHVARAGRGHDRRPASALVLRGCRDRRLSGEPGAAAGDSCSKSLPVMGRKSPKLVINSLAHGRRSEVNRCDSLIDAINDR